MILLRKKAHWVYSKAFIQSNQHTWSVIPGKDTGKYTVRDGSHLSSCVGADVHPGLSSIEPEDSGGALGAVGHDQRHRAIKGHGVVKLVLVNVHVVQAVGVTITEGETIWASVQVQVFYAVSILQI